MGVEAFNDRMYCNTSDVEFGPSTDGWEETEALISYCFRKYKKDPRCFKYNELVDILNEMREEKNYGS